MGTPRALEWIKKQARQYAQDKTLIRALDRDTPPTWTVLAVSPCYDIEQIKEYLEDPDYDHVSCVKLVKD